MIQPDPPPALDFPGLELSGVEDFEDLFESAPCGYLSAAADGRIIRANATLEEWLGAGRGALSGRRFSDLLNIAGKIYYETHFAPLLRMQGFFHEVALDLVRVDGSSFPVLVNAVERERTGVGRFIRITVFNATDRRRYERELIDARAAAETASAALRGLNATLEDRVAEAVDERLKAEEALRQAQKMEAVGQLTGGIAHDFNNMLAMVLSALSLLERRLARGDSDVGQFIEAARDGANRAAALTHRLLAFARRQPLSPRRLDTNRLVANMSEMLRRTLGETVRLETVLAGGLWAVHADGNQLENAIVNLAVNARDAMPEGGRLTIETANSRLDERYAAEHAIAEGQYVMIAVTDTGSGMPPEVVEKAFDPFYTTKPAGKGTGLGLSQVFGFVKQSGGHVKIYSEEGQGTTVKIYLPRVHGEADETTRRPVEAGARGDTNEVVLVVEDDERVRALTCQMVRELGYGCLEAASGADALRLLDLHAEVALLFTDVVMPDMNGRELWQAARRLQPKLRVLFTSGYTQNAVVHNGIVEPRPHLLPKPATLDQLASRIRKVLDE
jgi:PAS domain S-box-containing protein